MIDELLEAKELSVEDAKRKLAWLEDEHRVLQRLLPVRQYIRLRSKGCGNLTVEEKARLFDLRYTDDARQFRHNEVAVVQTYKELLAATHYLEEYRRRHNLVTVINEPGNIERNPLQHPVPAAELRHRRRAKNEDASPNGDHLEMKKSSN